MKWEELLKTVGDEVVFSSSLLLAGTHTKAAVQLQLSRWVKAGKIIKLRKGLYMLGYPYRKREPHPFLLSNRIKKASYISMQSALSLYGMIPEYVPAVTAVTTQRPETMITEAGTFIYRHVQKSLFSGYTFMELSAGQSAFIAVPEKCLLDLIYLTTEGDTGSYIQELRLQNLEILDLSRLSEMAAATGSLKLQRAAAEIVRLAAIEGEEYQEL